MITLIYSKEMFTVKDEEIIKKVENCKRNQE
jgi:hypothetical protein